MKYYGTKNNKDYGFYLENFENAIEITDEYWSELLKAQSKGKIIIFFENSVIAVNPKEYSKTDGVWKKLSKEEIELNEENEKKQIRVYEIMQELDKLDKKRIRAIAEPSMKDENISWLEYYNNQINDLRNKLISLQN